VRNRALNFSRAGAVLVNPRAWRVCAASRACIDRSVGVSDIGREPFLGVAPVPRRESRQAALLLGGLG
jgi:hypothetical protein